jgi:hypothetical protein
MTNYDMSRQGFIDLLKGAAAVTALGAVGLSEAGCSTQAEVKAGTTPSASVAPSTVTAPAQKELYSMTPEQATTAQRLDDIKDIDIFNKEALKDRAIWMARVLADLSKRGKYPVDIFNQVVNKETGDKISAYNPWDKMLDKNADGVDIRAALTHNEALLYGYKTDMSTTVPEPLDVLVAEKLTSVVHMNHDGVIYQSFMRNIPKQGNAKALDAAKSVKDTVMSTKPGTYTDPHTNLTYDMATITLQAPDGLVFDTSGVFIDLSEVLGTTDKGTPAGIWSFNE